MNASTSSALHSRPGRRRVRARGARTFIDPGPTRAALRLAQAVPEIVRFGQFELDARRGELRKRGKRIRPAPQPASLLTLLATRPGQLVTRDEVRRHLWGGEVFVEYERSLNACLAHLRAILGDRADAPRYIETSPRRGYRFIAPVHRSRPFPQPTVAVLPLVNLTSDPALEYFVDGLTAALITELASISALRVISHQSVLHLKGSSRTLPEVAWALGADALIEGSAVSEAERVRLNVQLVALSPERHLWAKAYECAGEKSSRSTGRSRARSPIPWTPR